MITMGQPCNRCGTCCREELCDLALQLLVSAKGPPCPALESDGAEHACGLVLRASRYIDIGVPGDLNWKDEYLRKTFSEMLGVGRGCDMTMANWQKEGGV